MQRPARPLDSHGRRWKYKTRLRIMKRNIFLLWLVTATCLCSSIAFAADRIRVLKGAAVTGDITKIAKTDVTISGRVVPVNEIDEIIFEGEPKELATARSAYNRSQFEHALEVLSKIDTATIKREEVRDEVEFYRTMSAVRMALAGSGAKDAAANAGRQLFAFEKSHPDSHHYYEANEALGDLLVDLGKFEPAQQYYDRLAKTPWPEYQMRAAVLMGRGFDSKQQYDRAIKEFDRALAIPAAGSRAEKEKMAAMLGKGKALASSGKVDEGTRLIEEVINKADAEDSELHARAYNILGNSYLAANKKKDALLAFLHVDLLYSTIADQHAEALSHLADLWSEEKKTDRALEARETLRDKYPNSRWVQQ